MSDNEEVDDNAAGSEIQQASTSVLPSCPRCKKIRLTVCPGCQEASEQFPLAEYQETGMPVQGSRKEQREKGTAAEQYPLLECYTCGEIFRPVFYRVCAWCGNRFADGKTVDLKGFYLQIERRPAIVLTVLCLLFITLSSYFYWVLN